MSGSSSKDNDLYRNDEAVDPRVQVMIKLQFINTFEFQIIEVP